MDSRQVVLSCLATGGLTLALSVAVAAVLGRAARAATRDGRASRGRIAHVALMRGWLAYTLAAGVGVAAVLAIEAVLFWQGTPASLVAMPKLLAIWQRLFLAWFVGVFFATAVPGRWLGPAVRSYRAGRKAIAIGRLLSLRLRRSRAATAARAFAAKHDRRLW